MTTPARAMRLAAIDRFAGRLAGRVIRAYQKWLSPLKGPHRGCAHRLLHGDASCSQHVRTLVTGGGLLAAMPAVLSRFAACRAAAQQLDPPPVAPHDGSTRRPRRRHRRGQCCVIIPLPTCSTTRTWRG
ncbi:MAG TPA: membrane protein insertion efficiency factor YidD [Tepidisphaeraceae bacterium]|nr:membrane protein insertion efficiency factor YidD [Tepidisphaeraceae bacterium]